VDSWFFRLPAWAIQDGNYEDFRTGQTAEFAVEFYMPDWTVASQQLPPVVELAPGQRVEACRYSIVAEVVPILDHAWVIDCGVILAFCRGRLPEGLTTGSLISGEAGLNVDTWASFGNVDLPTMPGLVNRWQVRRILRDTAPWIKVAPRLLERDPTRQGWEVIEATNAWKDEPSPHSADYVFECELLSRRPPSPDG
jgi:hypothetical protein